MDGFDQVEDVTALDPLDVPARLDDLRLLKAGWLDGGGKALDGVALDQLATSFTTYYPNDLPLPYTFPTAGGGVQFEWRIGGVTPEIEIDLASLQGDWLSDDDDEAVIDLATTEGWTDLARRIAALTNPNPPGESA